MCTCKHDAVMMTYKTLDAEYDRLQRLIFSLTEVGQYNKKLRDDRMIAIEKRQNELLACL